MDKRTETTLNLNFLNSYILEDEIYLRLDKLQALCSAQILLDSHDTAPPRYRRCCYSMVIEDQVTELRSLIDQLFK